MGDAGMPQSLQDSVNTTKVSYAQLGKCGLRLSVPVLGAMSFGHKDWQPWYVRSTCNQRCAIYHHGHAEQMLLITRQGGRRRS